MNQTTVTYIATTVLILIIFVVGGVVTRMALSSNDTADPDTNEIHSYEECVAAGNPIMESFPEQCRTEDGRTFTRDIGNILEKTEMVNVATPRPGDDVGQTFSVEGEARGPWFFEASFSVVVENEDGEQIGGGIAEAQSEWMTEDFVPFVAEVSLDESYTGDATLILEKQNASGFPENADSLYFPIDIISEETSQNGEGTPAEQNGCYVGGCSGQVCSDDPDVITTCEWRPEYACYDDAVCERQNDGECGWTETETLRACLESPPSQR